MSRDLGLPDRYQVLAALGQGGQASVYRALDREAQREVALKVVRSEDERKLERFRREAQATAAISHPNVMVVHDAGRAGATAWIAYDLIETVPWADVVASGSVEERLALFRQVVAGVAAAHAQGMTHRDLKPENLLIDAGGHVRVADFGLALISREERLTLTGQLMGTMPYMSPEQWTGEKEAVGPTSDVWALGVILYELLADELPFPGPGVAELVEQVDRCAPDLALVPRSLHGVLGRCLARNPGARFPDAGALGIALDAGEAPTSRRALPILAACAVVLLGVAALAAGSAGPTVPAPLAPATPDPLPTRSSSPAGSAATAVLNAIQELPNHERGPALHEWLRRHPTDPRRAAIERAAATLPRFTIGTPRTLPPGATKLARDLSLALVRGAPVLVQHNVGVRALRLDGRLGPLEWTELRPSALDCAADGATLLIGSARRGLFCTTWSGGAWAPPLRVLGVDLPTQSVSLGPGGVVAVGLDRSRGAPSELPTLLLLSDGVGTRRVGLAGAPPEVREIVWLNGWIVVGGTDRTHPSFPLVGWKVPARIEAGRPLEPGFREMMTSKTVRSVVESGSGFLTGDTGNRISVWTFSGERVSRQVLAGRGFPGGLVTSHDLDVNALAVPGAGWLFSGSGTGRPDENRARADLRVWRRSPQGFAQVRTIPSPAGVLDLLEWREQGVLLVLRFDGVIEGWDLDLLRREAD